MQIHKNGDSRRIFKERKKMKKLETNCKGKIWKLEEQNIHWLEAEKRILVLCQEEEGDLKHLIKELVLIQI